MTSHTNSNIIDQTTAATAKKEVVRICTEIHQQCVHKKYDSYTQTGVKFIVEPLENYY